IASTPSPPARTTGGSKRFSSTVRLAKIPRSSGQNASPSRAMRFDSRSMSSRPSRRTEPRRRLTMPMIDLSVVVLPAPLRPSSVTISPWRTSKSTPWRMCDSPYHASSPRTASSGSGMARAHVGLDHIRVPRHAPVVALGEDLPPRQRERRRDLQRALAPVRELDRRRRRERGQTDRLDQLERAPVQPVERALRAPEVERAAALALQRDAYVLEHREMREYRRDLERADETEARDVGRPRAGDVPPVESDAPACRREEVRQQIEAGRLAGAVGPDQRVNGAAADAELHVLHRHEPAKLLGQRLRLEDDVVGHLRSGRGAAGRTAP